MALELVTNNPAEILGIADRVGTLAPGKDADIAVFSGDPLDLMQRVERVYVNGAPGLRVRAESSLTLLAFLSKVPLVTRCRWRLPTAYPGRTVRYE